MGGGGGLKKLKFQKLVGLKTGIPKACTVIDFGRNIRGMQV